MQTVSVATEQFDVCRVPRGHALQGAHEDGRPPMEKLPLPHGEHVVRTPAPGSQNPETNVPGWQ